MKSLLQHVGNWSRGVANAWDEFWFRPAAPHTLAVIRILAGAMLFYTHFVWTLDLNAFLGSQSWIPSTISREIQAGRWSWSYLWYIDSTWLLWTLHILALVVLGMLTLGLFTRVTSILALIITLSYCHRLPGVMFGLDQVNAMFALYLAIGPSGDAYSIDRWRARVGAAEPRHSVSANVAVRLIQLHLCVIYLFGGIGKMRGEMWWDGSAVWYAIANAEYQTLNLTWLVRYPWLIALLTHATVFWETFYCFSVWPKLTRPVTLLMAVGVHAGIAVVLGMPTFGLAMLIANLAFVSPTTCQSWISWMQSWTPAFK